ncbi:MAG: hypothetical protein V4622_09125 [Bacteroidota bacterium]
MKNSIKFILFIALGFSNYFFSQETNSDIADTIHWTKIGETVINYENDRNEVLIVSPEKFNELEFIVKLAPIELFEIVVFYKNGDQQKFQVNESVKSEGFSQELELNGRKRIISKVIFQSRTISNLKEKRATIEVWGKND